MFIPTLVAAAVVSIQSGSTIYDFKVKDIDGKYLPLAKYEGKVLLVVNVASKCGLTPQYEKLQSLYEAKKDKGLVVLGFPANDFRGQEPGTEAEIKQFCSSTYNVTFPMFSKVVVTGEEATPLYKWLVAKGPRQDPIEWNFAKFVIGRDGKIAARFAPKVAPDSPEVTEAIDAALKTG